MWHEDLQLEIAVEFIRLSTPHWERFEDRVWMGMQYAKVKWADHGQWWRKTTVGKRYFAKYARRRAARLKRVVVATRCCVACGSMFELSAYREKRKRNRVCSNECRGAARKNIQRISISGESRTLTEWCARAGLKLSTVHKRIKKGWDVQRALGTPVRTCGHASESAPAPREEARAS